MATPSIPPSSSPSSSLSSPSSRGAAKYASNGAGSAAARGSHSSLAIREEPVSYPEWKFAQCFGDKNESAEVSEADIISAIKFDGTGEFLASGDRAGRVVMFERNQSKHACEYKFFTEFQSHEPEFDYLKSQEINERIGQIAWIPRHSSAHSLLTANEKTIKLWRVRERATLAVLENNYSMSRKLAQTDVRLPLILPKLSVREAAIMAHPKRVYGNVHAYHINSVSPCSDGEMFLSADDLRINLWHYGRAEDAYSLVDVKPERIEELSQVITKAVFHPTSAHSFAYGFSKGTVHLADLRCASRPENIKVFDGKAACDADPASRTQFFRDVIGSVADIAFSPASDKLMATRDYLTVKLWDLSMERRPVAILPVHDYIRPRLTECYENDAIFDKFECTFAHGGSRVLTGSYHNFVRQFDSSGATCDQVIHSDKSIFRTLRKQASLSRSTTSLASQHSQLLFSDTNNGVCEVQSGSMQSGSMQSGSMHSGAVQMPFGLASAHDVDFERKILQLTAHPSEPTLAVAALTNLFIFTGGATSSSGSASGNLTGAASLPPLSASPSNDGGGSGGGSGGGVYFSSGDAMQQ